MVIGDCGKVPRNTGIDPDAIAQTWRDRVHLQAHGSAAAASRAGPLRIHGAESK
jgi:hypothetical protein